MWQPNGDVIQLVFGKGVTNLMTSPDSRNFLEKYFNTSSPPTSGDLVGYYIKNFRSALLNKGINLPLVLYSTNNSLPTYEYHIFISLEWYSGVITTNISDLFINLEKHVTRYHQNFISNNNFPVNLQACLNDIQADNYQYAFDRYTYIYYSAKLQANTFVIAQVLNDCSLIYLRNLNGYDHASKLIWGAMQLTNVNNFVDINLKAQVYFNVGQICKVGNYFTEAYDYFYKSFQYAEQINNISHMFMTSVSLGETANLMGDNKLAIIALKYAQDLLIKNQGSYEVVFELEQKIKFLEIQQVHKSYEPLLNRTTHSQPQLPAKKESLINLDSIFSWVVQALIKVGVETVAYKIIGVSGKPTLSIFGKQNYTFNERTIFIENAKHINLKNLK